MTPDTVSTRGLLARAFAEGSIAPIEWVDLELDGLRITVAGDAVRASVDDELLRLPLSYEEQVAICRERDWVSPWLELCAAMVKQATRRPASMGLVRDGHPEDQTAMRTLGFSRRFSRRLDGLFAAAPPGLAAGPWKWWILHPQLAVRGAVNHGAYGERVAGVPVQGVGTAHDQSHWDYMQILQPVKRVAVDMQSGRQVDLLQYLAPRVPARFLDVYREQPAAPAPAAYPLLSKGSKGEDVRQLQAALNAAGASPGLNADGDFGARTDAAVRAFQAKRGLVVDGFVGGGTWSSLLGHEVKVVSHPGGLVAPAVLGLFRDANELAPGRSKASDGTLPSPAHLKQNPNSGHNTGNAGDLTHDPDAGFDCREWAAKALEDPRCLYVIFDRRISSRARRAEGWRPYTGTNGHTAHMHVEVDPAQREDASPWPWAPS